MSTWCNNLLYKVILHRWGLEYDEMPQSLFYCAVNIAKKANIQEPRERAGVHGQMLGMWVRSEETILLEKARNQRIINDCVLKSAHIAQDRFVQDHNGEWSNSSGIVKIVSYDQGPNLQC